MCASLQRFVSTAVHESRTRQQCVCADEFSSLLAAGSSPHSSPIHHPENTQPTTPPKDTQPESSHPNRSIVSAPDRQRSIVLCLRRVVRASHVGYASPHTQPHPTISSPNSVPNSQRTAHTITRSPPLHHARAHTHHTHHHHNHHDTQGSSCRCRGCEEFDDKSVGSIASIDRSKHCRDRRATHAYAPAARGTS